LPDIADIFAKGMDRYDTPAEEQFIFEAYSQCYNISIDYGVMEKAENVFVFAADFGWSDVGTWNSLYLQLDKDGDRNAVQNAKTYLSDVSNSMINSANRNKLIVVKGLDNYLVVDTDDVLMICPRDSENVIKQTIADVLVGSGVDFI
jgi:mannose-1-phosphate guanylyltransferase